MDRPTLVVTLTLGLAIGSNAAIYSVVNAVLLKPLPYPAPERLVRMFPQHPRTASAALSPADFHATREHTGVFAGVRLLERDAVGQPGHRVDEPPLPSEVRRIGVDSDMLIFGVLLTFATSHPLRPAPGLAWRADRPGCRAPRRRTRRFARQQELRLAPAAGGRTGGPVIGVVGDVKPTPVALEAEPVIYVPLPRARLHRTRLIVRTERNPRALLPDIQQVVSSIDPDLPVFDVTTLEDIAAAAVATERFAPCCFLVSSQRSHSD